MAIVLGILFSISNPLYAQEEESAEISLEQNIDEFQEHFFEALKQRGIENYEKAIVSLLKCKRITNSPTLDFELGKNYFSLKQYLNAEEAFQNAVHREPQNQWFLVGLFNSQVMLNKNDLALATGNKIIKLYPQFREQVARLQINSGNYEAGLALLDELESTIGLTSRNKALKNKALRLSNKTTETAEKQSVEKETVTKDNSFSSLITVLDELLQASNYQEVYIRSQLALDEYPSQPKLYLYNGNALNALKKYKNAIEILEIGVDYIIDDLSLEKRFYEALIQAYKAEKNDKKVTYYQNKLAKT